MTTRTDIEKSPDELKHKYLLAGFCLLNLLAPYITGFIILTNQKRLTRWGWLDGESVQEKEIKFDKLELKNENPIKINGDVKC